MKPITIYTVLLTNITAVAVSWRISSHARQSSISYSVFYQHNFSFHEERGGRKIFALFVPLQ